MTDLLSAPRGTRGAPAEAKAGDRPDSPRGRRRQPPRWRDTRLLAGVLLILVSMVLGARFIGTATKSLQWLSVTKALAAGHLLTAGDLTPVKAHLPASAGRQYFTADASQLVGRSLTKAVAAGELLAANAVSIAHGQASRVVPLIVKAGRMPAVSAGDHVDVYVLSQPSGGGNGREIRVLTDVEFVGEDVLSSGETSVSLRVAPAAAITAIAASQSGRVDVVRIDGPSADGAADAGPSTAPGFNGG